MTVITIARQYGGRAEEVAQRVCDTLGYHYFGEPMIRRVLTWRQLAANVLINYHEDTYKARTFIDRLRGYRPFPGRYQQSTGRPCFEGALEATDQIGESMLVWLTAKAIRLAYDMGDTVIVGRGGQMVLHELPGVLHVCFVASVEQRAQRVAEHEKIEPRRARQVVIDRDRAAADYFSRYYGVNWADPRWYHLVVNADYCSVDAATDLIQAAVGRLTCAAAPPGATV